MINQEISLRLIGFIASLILTFSTYYLIVNANAFSLNGSILFIFLLALVQSLVQLVCFIDVWKEEGGTRWNLAIFASTVSIIFIVVYFSIWIINHLNYHMH